MARIHSSPKRIPHFGLYGEGLKSDPGFVHIENIATRSGPNGWIIQPHRHTKLFQLLCMSNGELEVQLDDTLLSLQGSWAITIPAGTVHGFRFLPHTEGIVLTIAEPLLLNENYHNSNNLFAPLLNQHHAIELSQGSLNTEQLTTYLTLITTEIQHSATGHDTMIEWLVRTTLMTLRRQLAETTAGYSGAKNRLLSQFKALLNFHYHEQWPVAAYAATLHTSTSSLNRLCHDAFGSSAKTVIQDRVISELKRRLLYSTEAIDQIGYSLGFKDPGYLSRFFKKHVGISPSDYRNRRDYQAGEKPTEQ